MRPSLTEVRSASPAEHRGSVNLDPMTLSGLASYAQVGHRTLARAHTRSGGAAMISGYMGRGTRFEDSATAFAASYADQVAEDHRTLVEAAKSGRVTATRGLWGAAVRCAGRG
jgi:Uncharacterized protein conserved in bacteria (DUF2252)